jgi:hypothetical protein
LSYPGRLEVIVSVGFWLATDDSVTFLWRFGDEATRESCALSERLVTASPDFHIDRHGAMLEKEERGSQMKGYMDRSHPLRMARKLIASRKERFVLATTAYAGQQRSGGPLAAHAAEEDSAAMALQGLEKGRREFLTEAEYQMMRRGILEQLKRGPRVRPLTVLTFAFLGVLALAFALFATFTVPIYPGVGYGPVITGIAAVGLWALLVRGYYLGFSKEVNRSLDQRLAELEEVREQKLVSDEEYQQVLAGILISRQRKTNL